MEGSHDDKPGVDALPVTSCTRQVEDMPGESGPIYSSEALLRGGWTAHIDHAGRRYTLRLTRQGKLILTR